MELKGLTDAEVKERKERGEINSVEPIVSRSYKDIFVKNTFTPFNLILFAMGAVLLILGEYRDAFAATGIIILNIIVATIQESKAKRRLDQIALLLRPKVTVIRNGTEVIVDQAEIVKDDIIKLNPGDQALVDGITLESDYLEMDESLLTGESHTVRKHVQDRIYSGSYCVTGFGYYQVDAFGDSTFASKMLSSAKKYKAKKTPLQIETTAVTELLMIVAVVFMFLMVIINIIKNSDLSIALELIIKNAVIVLDIVPIALFLLIVIAYMISAIRMANKGVLLQNSSAVESLSHVDVVCMDKTGTITTNKLVYNDMVAYRDGCEEIVKAFANATGSKNRTIEALIEKFGKTEVNVKDEIRFSSDRKYSAVRMELDGKDVSVYMGAYPSLSSKLDRKECKDDIEMYSSKGLRTILLAVAKTPDLYDSNGDPIIPDLELLAVIAIEDEVRPDCRETIDVFLNNGMDIKVISGDDPVTVNSLFEIAKIPGERKIISGEELDALSGDAKEKAILECNIFGRMKPDHKEKIINTLKNHGKYVAMVGDGVNDVKSLKAAQVGVALESGAGAARGVADIVLLNDDFSALPKSLVEGKRTVSGMRNILRLYLARNFVFAFMVFFIMIVISTIMDSSLSLFQPMQASFYALVSVGIVAFLMAIWAEPTEIKGAILPGVLNYAIPVALVLSIFAVGLYIVFYNLTLNGTLVIDFNEFQLLHYGIPEFDTVEEMCKHYGVDNIQDIPLSRTAEINARNALLLFAILAGISQIVFVMPIRKFFSIDGKTVKDVKPTILMCLLFAFVALAYWVVDTQPLLQKLITLVSFPLEYALGIIVAVVVWWFIMRQILRRNTHGIITKIAQKWFDNKYRKLYMSAKEEDDVQVED